MTYVHIHVHYIYNISVFLCDNNQFVSNFMLTKHNFMNLVPQTRLASVFSFWVRIGA